LLPCRPDRERGSTSWRNGARTPALRVAKTKRRKFAEKTHDHVVGEWNPRMIAKLLLQSTVFIVAIGALLFASAGTLHWPAAWIFLVTSATIGPACGFWLAKTDPALLAERMRPTFQADQPAADKKFMLAFVAALLVWLVAIGLDHRAQASRVPLLLQVLGLVMYLLSTAFIMWVFRENSFAAPVVKVQAARHHRVVSSGPYAFVRHPMYSGVMLFFLGVPLLLGSWWGVAIAPVFAVLFAIRARIEERALVEGLPDYADYAARVRYRLVPGLW
jgi:protein-S-isoprenylcysteine O-methyltransferase Ste14